MDDPYISRAEHEEFSRRLAEENKRQDKRIEMLEENVREMRALTNSVERLATQRGGHGQGAGEAGQAPGSAGRTGR